MSDESCDLQTSLHSDTGSFVKRMSSGLTDYGDRLNADKDSVSDEATKIATRAQSFSMRALECPDIKNIARVAVDTSWTAAKFTGKYSLLLVMKTLGYLHQPLALLLSFYLFTLMASYASQRVFQGLSPICAIPVISSLSICLLWKTPPPSGSSKSAAPKSPDYSLLMNVQSKSFDHLLQELAGGAGLSLEIKKAEMATSDLVARVRLSELSARDSIARVLSEFVIGAKKTGRDLQRLTSKVGGSVDE